MRRENSRSKRGTAAQGHSHEAEGSDGGQTQDRGNCSKDQ